MHVLNRFSNRKASSISSFRKESYLLHEKIYVTLALLSMITSLGISLVAGPGSFVLLFILSLAGFLYNTPILPDGWRFQSLKDLPGSKNISTAVAWASVTALLPWIALVYLPARDFLSDFGGINAAAMFPRTPVNLVQSWLLKPAFTFHGVNRLFSLILFLYFLWLLLRLFNKNGGRRISPLEELRVQFWKGCSIK